MSVKHGAEVGTFFINCEVERIFNRRAMNTYDCSVGEYLHNVLAAKIALVDTRRAYPDDAVRVLD